MKKLILLALALMLVVITVAAQAPPPTQNQPPSAQAPPPSPAQPQATQPTAPMPPREGQIPKQPDRLDFRVERISARLPLTDDQKAKAKAIFKEEEEQNQAIRLNQALDQKQKIEKEKVVYATSREKFKKILTPEQLAKYDARSGAAHASKPAAAAPATPAPAAPANPAPAAPAKPAS